MISSSLNFHIHACSQRAPGSGYSAVEVSRTLTVLTQSFQFSHRQWSDAVGCASLLQSALAGVTPSNTLGPHGLGDLLILHVSCIGRCTTIMGLGSFTVRAMLARRADSPNGFPKNRNRGYPVGVLHSLHTSPLVVPPLEGYSPCGINPN
jgi:hypothetical protein